MNAFFVPLWFSPHFPGRRKCALAALVGFCAAADLFAAEDVSLPASGSAAFEPSTAHPIGWRGDGSGQYPSANPVTHWSATENVRWKAEVGAGHSSPIVVGQRVLVTAEPDLLVCLDAETGKELWRKAHKLSDLPNAPKSESATRSSQYGDATPTPVSDGKRVWVFFGPGIVACHDLDGTVRWVNWYDLRQNTSYGRTASPVLIGDRLLVHFGPLACLEAATGKLLWKNDATKATYGTPAPARIGNEDVVITPKGHVVRVADGKMLASDLGNCMYASPLVQGRVVYFVEGAMTAVQLPEQPGDQIECKELWSGELTGDFFASPVFHGGRLYAIDKAGNFYVLDAPTGKTVRSQKLQWARAENANVYPSLCLAGKHLFAGNDAGETLLLQPGEPAGVAGANSLPHGSGATPVFRGKRLYLRGDKFLYCIEGP
jgi:outer membrane protein assembly factor BamB